MSLAKYRKIRYYSSNGNDILVHIKYCPDKKRNDLAVLQQRSVNVGTSTVYTFSKLF